MPTFLFAYRSPTGYQPTGESTAAWMTWFEGMGDEVVDLGKPVVERTSVGHCNPETTELGGYSLISAPDLDTALVVAKGCPLIDRNGGVEIGELGDVPDSAA